MQTIKIQYDIHVYDFPKKNIKENKLIPNTEQKLIETLDKI